MKTLTSVENGPQVQPVIGVGRTAGGDAAPRTRSAEPAPPGSGATGTSAPTDEDLAAALKQLQEALDQAGGPRRDVELGFEDGEFYVEIRRRSDGLVIQRFPPENLLNPRGSSADLVGTVVDRRS
ncbi:MAG: hypothetical protein R3D98_14655 [Candidatus Krumholzibacteriia bacterium]